MNATHRNGSSDFLGISRGALSDFLGAIRGGP